MLNFLMFVSAREKYHPGFIRNVDSCSQRVEYPFWKRNSNQKSKPVAKPFRAPVTKDASAADKKQEDYDTHEEDRTWQDLENGYYAVNAPENELEDYPEEMKEEDYPEEKEEEDNSKEMKEEDHPEEKEEEDYSKEMKEEDHPEEKEEEDYSKEMKEEDYPEEKEEEDNFKIFPSVGFGGSFLKNSLKAKEYYEETKRRLKNGKKV